MNIGARRWLQLSCKKESNRDVQRGKRLVYVVILLVVIYHAEDCIVGVLRHSLLTFSSKKQSKVNRLQEKHAGNDVV